ncbi:protein NTM1-like 9 isoform X1 [Primulina huaijiensis]|uniref:protein NTM1-like 9 isoform X1 n=1 Tax=Primulina huaijiensis TaxID=1492673 RepID=UPI003CC73AF4
MMKLEALPKGFRFRPTDEELVNHYLRFKINGHHSAVGVIPEVDVCKWEPWDLPALSVIKSDDREWFYFCPRDRKYPNGHRSNRATEAGYWKATGKDRTIKSRKSSPSYPVNANVIGTKKTLVFYRGRAPKGERTNWIMHEYRATEPDLDGTGPGQGDYVLCRLFHKTDEKRDDLKYDEVEPTRSSPSGNISSPDEVSSDLFQEPKGLAAHLLNELEDVKKWEDELNYRTPTLAPVERCASHGLSHSKEGAATEVYESSRLMSEEARCSQLDNKFVDPLHSLIYNDMGNCIGSPFADDFGDDHNGLNFQDGTYEQDASLSELWEVLKKNDNYLCKESVNHEPSAATRESLIPWHTEDLDQTRSASCKVNDCKLYGETDKMMVQAQIDPAYHSFYRYAHEENDALVNKVKDSCQNSDNSSYHTLQGKASGSSYSESAIKIQSRHPRNQPSSMNSGAQGIASRRIRLSIERGQNSVCYEKSNEVSDSEEQESLVTEAAPNISKDAWKLEGRNTNENKETAQTCNSRLELQVKHAEKNGCSKIASFIISLVLSTGRDACYLNLYAISIYLVLILLIVSLGIWKFRSVHEVHG